MAEQQKATVKYKANGITSVSHEKKVYKVDKTGHVDLPAGESWYRDLVEAKILTPPEEAGEK